MFQTSGSLPWLHVRITTPPHPNLIRISGDGVSVFCQSSPCASVEFTVQAMNHPCTEVFPGADLPSHLGCAFWGGHLDVSTIRNSQGLPACAKGSSKSHDYSPSQWALVTSETSEKHKSKHICWQCQEPKLVFTLPDPAKKIRGKNSDTKIRTRAYNYSLYQRMLDFAKEFNMGPL